MEPADWFAQLLDALPDGLAPVTDEERVALLDLARVAAHTSERWTAPISTFLVGVAYAGSPPEHRAEVVRELVRRFDAA